MLRHARDVTSTSSWDFFKREYREESAFKAVGSDAKELFFKHLDKLKAKEKEKEKKREKEERSGSEGSGDEGELPRKRKSRCGGWASAAARQSNSSCLVL